MTDIILVVPPKSGISVTPPLGLGYLASSLRKDGVRVKLWDFARQRLTSREAASRIAQESPRFVGLSVMTYNYKKAKELIELIKRQGPKIGIIIGGSHISALPRFSLYDLGADFAICGEAEEVLSKIIKACDSQDNGFERIEGLAYKEKGVIKVNPGVNIVKDLDSLPMPAWDLIDPRLYRDSPGYFFPRGPSAPVITSRGCPHRCSFCTSRVVHGTKIRHRSPENFVDEIEMLARDFGIHSFDFCDDSFTENKPYAVSVCGEIISRGLNIEWKTPVGIRLDSIDEELLEAMKRSGCYEIGFGIESYNQEVLRLNGKPLNRSNLDEKVNLVKKFNLEVMGFFILGLPGDTRKSIEETITFAKDSPFDLVHFSCAVPFPGTEMFEASFSGDSLPGIDWDKFTFSSQFNTSQVGVSDLKLLLRKAFVYSYIRPLRFARLIRIFSRLRIGSFLKTVKYIFYYLIK